MSLVLPFTLVVSGDVTLRELGGGYYIAAGSGQPAANVLLDVPRGRCSRRWQVAYNSGTPGLPAVPEDALAGRAAGWLDDPVVGVQVVTAVVVVIDLLPSGLI